MVNMREDDNGNIQATEKPCAACRHAGRNRPATTTVEINRGKPIVLCDEHAGTMMFSALSEGAKSKGNSTITMRSDDADE